MAKGKSFEGRKLTKEEEKELRAILGGRLYRPKSCFYASHVIAISSNEYRYYEGYARVKDMEINIEHGWLVRDGKVFDPTWKDGLHYFGVEVPKDTVRKQMVATGRADFILTKCWEDSLLMASFKGVGKIYYLTREIVERWKEGLDKTWLNFKLKVLYVIGISGDYAYFIRVQNPREISFQQVPDFYKKCVNPKKKIYEYNAKLERIEKRELRKNVGESR